MQTKKVQNYKQLDPHRPNVLPRLHTAISPEKSKAASINENSESLRREKLFELLSQSDDGPTRERTNVIKILEEKRKEELEQRKDREMKMFTVGFESIDSFTLPGKPAPHSLISPADLKKGRGRLGGNKMKSSVETAIYDGSSEPKDPFAFISEALGYDTNVNSKFHNDSTTGGGGGHSMTQGNENNKKGDHKNGASSGGGGGHQKSPDLEQIEEILAKIKTGEDAVHFFARNGSETAVKFVYLKQKEPKYKSSRMNIVATGMGELSGMEEGMEGMKGLGNDTTMPLIEGYSPRQGNVVGEIEKEKEKEGYRPYDLIRVDLKDLPNPSEYFIMSPAGIVHVSPGEASECIPLSAWVRQGMVFNILRNIRFYKLFMHR